MYANLSMPYNMCEGCGLLWAVPHVCHGDKMSRLMPAAPKHNGYGAISHPPLTRSERSALQQLQAHRWG